MKDINNDIKEEKLTITVEEASKRLGIGKNIMLDLVKKEGFPSIQFKRKILIHKALFDKWVEDLVERKNIWILEKK